MAKKKHSSHAKKKSATSTSSSSKQTAAEELAEKKSKNKKRRTKEQKRRLRKKILVILGITAVVLAILSMIGAAAALAYFSKDLPDPHKLIDRDVAETTKIYARDEKTVLYEIHGDKNRTLIDIKTLPPYVKDATIALEDANFYQNHGFEIKSIVRAVWLNVVAKSKVQGGSTITQQLVKNAILSNEKTFTRKIKELILAVEIERTFSKDDIIQLYLNEIPYGSSAYGIYAASDTFFNKKPQDLTLAEAAYLASMPQAPTYYSPYGSHLDQLKERQQYALTRMEDLGMITHDQAEAAKKEDVKFSDRQDQGIIAAHFVFYIKEQLEEKYGTKELEQGGLKIITTLDYNMQLKAEKAVSDHVDFIKKYGASNLGLAAVDPKKGEILAMVGSKNYFDTKEDGNVNVTTSLRQPGSSFKPYVYATAFSKGLTPDTPITDVEMDFGQGYHPRNYDLGQHGPMRLKDALTRSLNLPAVQVGYIVGVDNAAALARNMGVEDLKEGDTYGLSTALGAKEVKLIDHVGAFGVFANQGKKVPKTGILKIIDKKGNILEEHKPDKGTEQVLDANIANTINDVLSDKGLRQGSFRNLNLSRPGAAKTGTSNEFRDAWTVGYTPNLAAGVWVGNNDGSLMHRGADGSIVAAPIWRSFMEDALTAYPVENFAKPSPIQTSNAYAKGTVPADTTVKLCKPSMKLANEYCPADLIVEKTYKTVHSILFYIDRNNIAGPPPAHPEKDPLFKTFEDAYRGFATKNGDTIEDPPTDVDDLHNPDKKPTVTITSPQANDTVTSSTMTIAADVKAPLTLDRVDFYVDKTLVQSDTKAPFSTFYTINIPNGFHTIRVVARDYAENQGEASLQVNFKVEQTKPTLNLLAPSDGSVIKASDFPYLLSASPEHITNVSKVTFYFKPVGGNSQIITVITTPTSSGQYNGAWQTNPGAGIYEVYANATDGDGNVVRSNSATITIQ